VLFFSAFRYRWGKGCNAVSDNFSSTTPQRGKTLFPKVFIGFYSALVSCVVFLPGADLERKEQELVHGRNMFCP